MNVLTLQATLGGLLYGLEKLAVRAGEGPAILWAALPPGDEWKFLQEILCDAPQRAFSTAASCVFFAHGLAPVPDNSETLLAPLASIFTHLNGEHPGKSIFAVFPPEEALRHPSAEVKTVPAEVYCAALNGLASGLQCLTFTQQAVDILLGLLEHWCSTLPAGTASEESRDISLYDHLRLTAALAACVSIYAAEKRDAEWSTVLMQGAAEFRTENAFLLYAADFSGIQKFIYTVHQEGALRSLRSRSFLLEFLMEHYLDELLAACGLTRANVIYGGGGRCYVLLPNTEQVRQAAVAWNRAFNEWLRENFGTQLFLAHGWAECSADTLYNVPAENAPYKELYRRVGFVIGQHKRQRYSAVDVRAFNRAEAYPDATRECKVCGTSFHLNKDGLCTWCSRFQTLSGPIQNAGTFFISHTPLPGLSACFTLPDHEGKLLYFTCSGTEVPPVRLGDESYPIRVYTKNKHFTGPDSAHNLYVGDYAKSNSIEDLSAQSKGIRRIAVCRMDVDNLGQAFIAGFERVEETDPVQRMRYVSIARSAAFSRQMSLFFKYHINGLLWGLSVAIVYSGGDDVFLVGAWNDVLAAALCIRDNLTRYSCGALTISAGIGLFDDHFPIRAAAEKTAEMEDAAKCLPTKNAVSLFDAVPDYTYSWDVLREKVLGEKLACLTKFFELHTGDEEKRGQAMLYNLLMLLRMTGEDRINYARCAYLLARLAPSSKETEKYAAYTAFAHSVIDWANSAEERRQLITAIYIYVYQNRKGD